MHWLRLDLGLGHGELLAHEEFGRLERIDELVDQDFVGLLDSRCTCIPLSHLPFLYFFTEYLMQSSTFFERLRGLVVHIILSDTFLWRRNGSFCVGVSNREHLRLWLLLDMLLVRLY